MSRMSEEYKAYYYRTDHHKSFERAKKLQALWSWETTYGYSATADAIVNARRVAIAVDGGYKEIKIVWCVDGVELPECYFEDSVEVLGEYEQEETK
jgi:hypothetical protein